MASSPKSGQLLALYQQLRSGSNWRQASRAVGLAKSTAWEHATRIWPSLRGRRPRLGPSRRQQIEEAILEAVDASYRALAREYTVSPDTISRLARCMIDRQCQDLPATRNVRRYRCEGCGMEITVRPCVLCRARAFRR